MKRALLAGTALAAGLVFAAPAFADEAADQAMLNDAVFRPSEGVTLPSQAPKLEKTQLLLGVSATASTVALADGVGIHIPEFAVLTPGSGVKGGFTNSTSSILVFVSLGNGSDSTNDQHQLGTGVGTTDPATKAECSAGNAKGIYIGPGYDGGAGGIPFNANGSGGSVGASPGPGCVQLPSTYAGAGNTPWVPTVYTFSLNTVTGRFGAFRGDTDIGYGASGTGAFSKTTLTANTVPDWNGDAITANACAACGLYLGNAPATALGRGAIGLGFFMLIEGRDITCNAAGSLTVTGWGTGTCPNADTIPIEFIHKITDATSKMLKEPGAGCLNFDSDGTKTVECLRFRRGALLTNEGTATAPWTMIPFGGALANPGGVGPYEECVGGGGFPTSGIYCPGAGQGHVTTGTGTSGTITFTTGGYTPVVGDAQVAVFNIRSTGGGSPTGLAITCPTGWSGPIAAPVETADWFGGGACYRIATDTNTSFSLSYTASQGTISQRYVGLLEYKGVTGFETATSGANCRTVNTSATTFAGVSGLSTSHANTVIVDMMFKDNTTGTLTSANQRMRVRSQPLSGPLVYAEDRAQAVAGSVSAAAWTGLANTGGSSCSLVMF